MFAHASLFPLSASNSCRKIRYNVGNPLMEYMKGERASKADRQRVIPHLLFFSFTNGHMWEDFYAGLVNIWGLLSNFLVSPTRTCVL
jgi:hypothetical protein